MCRCRNENFLTATLDATIMIRDPKKVFVRPLTYFNFYVVGVVESWEVEKSTVTPVRDISI